MYCFCVLTRVWPILIQNLLVFFCNICFRLLFYCFFNRYLDVIAAYPHQDRVRVLGTVLVALHFPLTKTK